MTVYEEMGAYHQVTPRSIEDVIRSSFGNHIGLLGRSKKIFKDGKIYLIDGIYQVVIEMKHTPALRERIEAENDGLLGYVTPVRPGDGVYFLVLSEVGNN